MKHMSDAERKAYVKVAQENYHEEGSIEIDDRAKISESVDGYWVQAWVWVDPLTKEET